MALDKPRNTSLPHANRPKVPTGSSMKGSSSDESSMRRNLKRPAIELSQLGDDIEEQDAIFRPWRGLSNLQDNINEEYELRKWAATSVVVYGACAASLVASLTNEESSCARPSKFQVESKKSKNKAIEFVCEELRSLRSGMDAVAMALEKGNLRNYSEEQLYDEITQV
ncbi:hypothetical protein Cgig2_028052 [Carnegiea gigantea]|uniref:Uncharacterized protein n=1 Tax=Carnegiea gigantea TaxID=171969 RepID=A0A9Q1JS73_9CARY|nr:hypothetical protein Cgig2_028052 [Carnegiea gigantea]